MNFNVKIYEYILRIYSMLSLRIHFMNKDLGQYLIYDLRIICKANY